MRDNKSAPGGEEATPRAEDERRPQAPACGTCNRSIARLPPQSNGGSRGGLEALAGRVYELEAEVSRLRLELQALDELRLGLRSLRLERNVDRWSLDDTLVKIRRRLHRLEHPGIVEEVEP